MRLAIRAIKIRLFKRQLRNRALKYCLKMVLAGVKI